MRTLTSSQAQALASSNRSTRYRVWVDSTGAGAFVNLSSLAGYDYVGDVSYGTTVDQPVDTADIKLARAVFALSLNPLMGTSKWNNGQAMVGPGRRIFVEAATTLLDVPVTALQWQRVFDGYIDDVDPSGEIMNLACRDLAALLVDTFIETERTYGSSLGVPVQTVMQSILNDNVNTPGLGSVTLYVPVAPTFLVLLFKQQKQSVMDALQALADQIGWAVRYRWDGNTGQFQLTLYQPDRAKTTPDYTFGPDDYYDVKTLRVSRKDVRNVVQLVYDDKTVATTAPLRQRVIVQDGASIAQYGRRWMELSEASTSQIDTPAEATTMATAALSDLAQPFADHEILADYFFASELADLYAFKPNGQHYDALQKFAVVGLKHELTVDGSARSTITVRGKPSTGYRRWLRMEGRPGVAPSAGFFDPAAPSSINAYAALGTVIVECVPPDQNNWTRTEVYMDTSAVSAATQTNGKYSGMADGLLVAKGKQTKFSIPGLTPGQTYYGRVQILDKDGNRSASSGQFQITTEMVSAYHTNTDNTTPILNPNSDFNAFTKGLALFPDAWGGADINSPWGSGQTVYYDGAAASGKFCATLWTGSRGLSGNTPGGGRGGIRTSNGGGNLPAYIPFAGNDIVMAAAYVKWGPMPGGVTSLEAMLQLDFYDLAKNPVGSSAAVIASSSTVPANSPDGWYLGFSLGANAPTGARYMSVSLLRYGKNNAGSGGVNPWGTGAGQVGLYIDRIALTRGVPTIISGLQGASGNQYITPNTPTPVVTYDNSLDIALGFWVPTSADGFTEWICSIPCTLAISFGFNVTALNSDPSLNQVWLEVCDLGGTWSKVASGVTFKLNQGESQDVTLSIAAQDMAAGEKLRGVFQNTHEANILSSSVVLLAACITRNDK